MAKVTFSTDIQSISGKLCSKEGVIYSVNQQTGKTYRSDRHGYSDPKPMSSRPSAPPSRRSRSSPLHGGSRTVRPTNRQRAPRLTSP